MLGLPSLLSMTAFCLPAWQSPALFLVRESMERQCLPSRLMSRGWGEQVSGQSGATQVIANCQASCWLDSFLDKGSKRSNYSWFPKQTWHNDLWQYGIVPTRNNGKNNSFCKAKQGQPKSLPPGRWLWKLAISFSEIKNRNDSQFHLLSDRHNLVASDHWKYLQDHKGSCSLSYRNLKLTNVKEVIWVHTGQPRRTQHQNCGPKLEWAKQSRRRSFLRC